MGYELCIFNFFFNVDFFKIGTGLRQGCPLSPLLFLIVVEGLSRTLFEAKSYEAFKGIKNGKSLHISQLLFVGHSFFILEWFPKRCRETRDIMDLYCMATCMVINLGKSIVSFMGVNEEDSAIYPNVSFYES